MKPEVEAFVTGLQHFPRLVGGDRPFVLYLDASMASAEELQTVFRGINMFNRTMGGRGYTFKVLKDPLQADDKTLHQIEASPITAETPN